MTFGKEHKRKKLRVLRFMEFRHGSIDIKAHFCKDTVKFLQCLKVGIGNEKKFQILTKVKL